MIILSPGLESNFLIQECIKKELQFFCYYNHASQYGDSCRIELWSNLTADKQWSGFLMSQIGNSQHFTAIVNTCHLPLGDYEFTLRFAATSKEPWSWYGRPGQNGHIRIVPRSIPVDVPSFAAVPQLYLVEKHCVGHTKLRHFRNQGDFHSFSLGSVDPSIHHYVALLRKGSSWLTPVCGKSNFDNHNSHEKWQFLLYQDSLCGDTHLWMTLGNNVDCWLSPGSKSTLNLNLIPYKDGSAHLLICSTSKKFEFAQLFQVALDYYRESIKLKKLSKFIPRPQPPEFEMLDVLGYCTWNAFGKGVTDENLYEAMESFKAHDIPVAYMIIDDGWSEVSNNQLLSMDVNRDKFSRTLKGTVDNLKSKYPHLKRVGVWHALWGYWDGICCDFKDNHYKGFILKSHTGKDVGLLTDPDKFYNDFYKFLQHSGIDFVKVDNQGAFQDICKSQSINVYELWDRYRTAMIINADKYLKSQARHCMSLTPHILFTEILSTERTSIFRSSDDYFPDEDDSHAWHIYANAINSLLLSQYPVVSDWDMFESHHPFAEYHASSRAISGGPVYITDTPNMHNTELIQKLVAETKDKQFTLLRSAQTPIPTVETVFGNVMEHGDLICLYNVHLEDKEQQEELNGYGVCGFWNTSTEDRLGIASSSIFRLESLALLPTVAYVVSGPDKGNSLLLNPTAKEESEISNDSIENPPLKTINDAMSVRVAGFSSSLVSFSLVRTLEMLSIACLGLVDKFNGTRCVKSTSIVKGSDDFAIYEAFLSHRSSQCGFWINSSTTRRIKPLVIPSRITIDGHELIPSKEWAYNHNTNLLSVDMTAVNLNDSPSGDDFHVQIYLNLMQ